MAAISTGTEAFCAGTEAFRAGTEAFPAGTKTVRPGMEAFPAGMKAFHDGMEAFHDGTKAFPAGKSRVFDWLVYSCRIYRSESLHQQANAISTRCFRLYGSQKITREQIIYSNYEKNIKPFENVLSFLASYLIALNPCALRSLM